ncbi:MAG: hypothetical protein HQ522_12485 [Bacteroidetes bacterium]|nr:hypothetical protein [Bacteroidota bacterium]
MLIVELHLAISLFSSCYLSLKYIYVTFITSNIVRAYIDSKYIVEFAKKNEIKLIGVNPTVLFQMKAINVQNPKKQTAINQRAISGKILYCISNKSDIPYHKKTEVSIVTTKMINHLSLFSFPRKRLNENIAK